MDYSESGKMSKEKQRELVESASQGNEEAFKKLYKEKARSILYNSYCILLDRRLAQEASKMVVINMFEGIKELDDPDLFNAWLQRLITKTCDKVMSKEVAS